MARSLLAVTPQPLNNHSLTASEQSQPLPKVMAHGLSLTASKQSQPRSYLTAPERSAILLDALQLLLPPLPAARLPPRAGWHPVKQQGRCEV